MSTHTPGPWTIQQAGYESFILGPIRGGRIASVNESDRPTEEERANAKLIAASPKLLEACELFVSSFCSEQPENVKARQDIALRMAREAIVEAGGSI